MPSRTRPSTTRNGLVVAAGTEDALLARAASVIGFAIAAGEEHAISISTGCISNGALIAAGTDNQIMA